MKIIKFYQKNCTPCFMLQQAMDQLELKEDESIEITPENIEQIKQEYDVMKTPTLIKFNEKGVELERLSSVGVSKINKFFK